MDKEKTCPKSKNATLSLSNVFMWAGKSGNKPWEKQWKVGTNRGILWKVGFGAWKLMYPQNGT
jgi:hypothetical protein